MGAPPRQFALLRLPRGIDSAEVPDFPVTDPADAAGVGHPHRHANFAARRGTVFERYALTSRSIHRRKAHPACFAPSLVHPLLPDALCLTAWIEWSG